MNEKEMRKIMKEIENLLIEKNKTYGEENITKIGKLGILTRLEEKIERLKHMITNNINDKDSRDDNWKDIAGYAILGEMLERGKWK
jgi:hypothetical protein